MFTGHRQHSKLRDRSCRWQAGPHWHQNDIGCPTRRGFRRVGTTDPNPMFTGHRQHSKLRDRPCRCRQNSIATTALDTFLSSRRVAIGGALCWVHHRVVIYFSKSWNRCGCPTRRGQRCSLKAAKIVAGVPCKIREDDFTPFLEPAWVLPMRRGAREASRQATRLAAERLLRR
jgi:hypothetical protein